MLEDKDIEKIINDVIKNLSVSDKKGEIAGVPLIVKKTELKVSPEVARGLIPVGISARHVHLSQKDLETLFGKGRQLTPMKNLLQKGEYAAEESVTLIGPRMKAIEKVRILGPVRNKTQVEISLTDAIQLGIRPPVKPSGEHDGTPGILIVGPVGFVNLKDGVIRANRHIHISTKDAEVLRLKDNDVVMVKICAERPLIYSEVQVRVKESFVAEMHLDTDDANASGVRNGDLVQILKSVLEISIKQEE